jgi:hypothetical protein
MIKESRLKPLPRFRFKVEKIQSEVTSDSAGEAGKW